MSHGPNWVLKAFGPLSPIGLKLHPAHSSAPFLEAINQRWEQVDLVHKKALTVGRSKTEADTGRVIPLNETALALKTHAAWYTNRFGECKPEWFVYAFGTPLPKYPTRPIPHGRRSARRRG